MSDNADGCADRAVSPRSRATDDQILDVEKLSKTYGDGDDAVTAVDDGRIVADESVDDLLALFDSQTYAVELAERPDRSSLAAFDVTWDGDRPAFEIVLAGSDRLYGLMARLRDIGADVRDLTSVESDLEDVFVRVREEGTNAVDETTTGAEDDEAGRDDAEPG